MIPLVIPLLALLQYASAQVDSKKFFCRQPGPVKGPCNEKIKRWYHNFQTGQCIDFDYGGCNGNYNNFESEADCESKCKGNSGAKFHSTKKAGKCVNYPNEPHWTPWGLCTHMCAQYDDASCPGDQKCCFNGCGFQCVHPDSASWGLKNGKCPNPEIHTIEKLKSSRHSLQVCMTDNSCFGRDKCCEYPEVGFVCVPALEDLEAPEKPGTCQKLPDVKPSESDCERWRKIPCQRDGNCKGSAKCCDLGCGLECSTPAELTTIPPSATPIPIEEEEGEEVCPLMGKRCGDGETPYMFCAQDSDCSTGQKCCHDGCGYVCAEPFWIPKIVPGPANKTTTATTTQAPTTTTTTTSTTTTTTTPPLDDGLSPFKVFGWCPPPSLCNATNFYLDCVTDMKCPFNKKCCFNGCGYQCIAPQLPKFLQGATSPSPSTTTSTTKSSDDASSPINAEDDKNSLNNLSDHDNRVVRRGFCGLEKKRCGGSGPATGETYFYQTCSSDADCVDDQLAKCCFDGCGYECVKPVFLREEDLENVVAISGNGEIMKPVEKSGVCPPPGIANAIVTLCRNDADCYGAYKCCNTMGGRECVPASLPVMESLSKPTAAKADEFDEESMSDNMEMKKATKGHAYCHVTSDIPLPSGQPPVVKGIVYLYETGFWGLNVKVKMDHLPVLKGLPKTRKFLFNVQVLDSSDPQTGCMFSAVHPGGNLGVVEADENGIIDGEAIKKTGYTIMRKNSNMETPPSKNIVDSILAISTVGSNQRVGCCRVRPCRDGCCQGPYTGHCMAYLKRFYFDWTSGECRQFVYGGCGAQENNFKTKDECLKKCASFRP